MDAPRMRVNCGVENCTHNRQHMCHASGVEINAAGGEAHSCRGTCCNTFAEQG